MTIKFHDAGAGDGLFDVLGKVFFAQAAINTARGTTVRNELVEVLTQVENLTESLELTSAISTITQADLSFVSGGTSAQQQLAQVASNLLVEIVNADTHLSSKTIDAAIEEMLRQMTDESETVDASTVTVSVADVGTPTGDGVFLLSVKRGDGRVAELSIPESLQLITNTAGPAAAIQFLAGAAPFNLLDAEWPQGSGVNTFLGSVEGSDGILSNGEFDTESTDYENTPEDWVILTGTAGSTIMMTDVEVQTITVSGSPTGGYYLIHWTNSHNHTQTTSPIPFDASGATLQVALRALTGLEGVDVTSTGTSPNYTHTITFTELGGNVGQFTSTSRMTGGTIVNEKQRISISGNPDGGTFTLSYAGQTTSALAYSASAATIEAALEALSNIDAITGTGGALPSNSADMEFGGSLAGTDVALMTINTGGLTKTAPSVTVTTTTAGGSGGVNEVQTITASGVPSGGTWTISWNGQTTSALAVSANAAAVQAALEALSNIAPGDVVVSGGTLGVAAFTLTWGGAYAATNVAQVTVDDSSLLGPVVAVNVVTLTEGSPSQNEVQQFQLYGTPTGGSFTLNFSGQTTSAISPIASNASITAALEALSNIGVGDVLVGGGPLPGSAVTVTFQGTLAQTNVSEMTINGANLTGGSVGVTMSTPTPGSTDLSSLNRAWWKFEESSGTRYDSVGNYDLFSNGTMYAGSGIVGSAIQFTDSPDEMLLHSFPTSQFPRTSSDFTLAFWYKHNTTSPGAKAIWSLSSTGPAGTRSFFTETDSFNRFKFTVTNSSIGGLPNAVATATTFDAIPNNTWCFVVCRWNFVAKTARICVNAGASNSGVGSGTYVDDTNVGAVISLSASSSTGTPTLIDESGFWSRELSDSEVTALYNVGIGVTTPLSGGTNEVQRITVTGSPAQGSFTLTYAGQTTADIPYNSSASAVDSALEDLSNIGAGDVTCTGGPLPATAVDIEFTGSLAQTDVAAIAANANKLKTSITTTTQGNTGTDESQRLSASPSPVAGTFTLTYSGQTTSALDFDATNSEIQSALEALSNLAPGDVVVSGGPINSANVIVQFAGTLSETDVSQMTSTSSLTGAAPTTLTAATTTQGVAKSNETQSFTLGPDVTGGTYTLSWNNGTSTQTTAAIPFNATFDDVRSALEATSTIAPGDVAVSGGPSPAAVAVTFQGAYAGLNVNAMTGSGAGLTQNAITGSVTVVQDGGSTGSITHATPSPGTPQVYSGAKALILQSNGSELTAIQQRLDRLQPLTPYGVHLWACADAVPAAGVLKVELIDGTDGSVIADDAGTPNVLTFSANALTTVWKSLTELVSGECVFRLPTNVPSIVYLRLRISTAVPTGRKIFLDRMTMDLMTELYAGGPWVSVIGGAEPFVIGDRFMMNVANNRAGLVQEWFGRNFNMAQLGLLLPSDSVGGETIPDSVIS